MSDEVRLSRNSAPPRTILVKGADIVQANGSVNPAGPAAPAGTQGPAAQMTVQQPMSSPAPPPKK